MKYYNSSTSCWIAILVFVFFGCSTTKIAQKNAPIEMDPNGELLIYIQQFPCLGKCPAYEASFYSGRRMVYEGKSNMPLLGKYEFYIPDDLTKSLIFSAVKLNVKQIPDSISIPKEAPVTMIWVVINGKMKKMIGWAGSGNETFKKYSTLVSTEVRSMIADQEGRKIP